MGGVMVARPTSKAECEAPEYRRCCASDSGVCDAWEYNSFDEENCDKCGHEMQNALTWEGGNWISGQMRPLNWRNRTWAPMNTVRTQIAWEKMSGLMDSVRIELEDAAMVRSVGCTFGATSVALGDVACGCGDNNEGCTGEKVAIPTVESAFAGIEQDLGFGIATKSDSLDPNADGGVTVFELTGVPAQSLQNSGIDAPGRRLRSTDNAPVRRRKLSGAESSTTASCFTTVTNDDDVYVGQVVGDCVTMKPNNALSGGVTMCLSVSSSIPQDVDAFPVQAFAVRDAQGKTRPADLTVTVNSGSTQYCASVQAAGTYCPVRHANNYQSVTVSADTSCGKTAALVKAVETGTTVNTKTGTGGGGGDGGGGDEPKTGAASTQFPASLTLAALALALAAERMATV